MPSANRVARTRARRTPEPGIRRQDVDGVPVFFAGRPGPLRAALLFRVGQADETLQQRGVTHLVEHLALSQAGMPAHAYNGATGRTFTSFVMAGKPGEVVEHLQQLCTALSRLPEDRFDHERGVLRAESATRGRSLLSLWRWGPADYGLIGYDELGLDLLGPGDAQAWADRYFHRGNAALWVTGAVPRGLALPLGDGDGHGPTVPPDPRRAVLCLPAWIAGNDGYTAFSCLTPREAPDVLSAGVLGRRLDQRLRHELGLVYGVDMNLDRLSSDVVEHTFGLRGAGPETAAKVGTETARVLAEVRDVPVRKKELTQLLAAADLADRNDLGAVMSQLDSRAQALLLRRPEPPSSDDFLSELRAVDPLDVTESLRASLESLLLSVPDGAEVPETLAPRAPMWSADVLTGLRLLPTVRHQAGLTALKLGEDGMTGITTDQKPITIRWADVAAVTPYTDGSRILLSKEGFFLRLMVDEWHDGARITEAVDRAVPSEKYLAWIERDVPADESPSPSGPPFSRVLLGAIAAGVFALLAVVIYLGSQDASTTTPEAAEPIAPTPDEVLAVQVEELSIGDCLISTTSPDAPRIAPCHRTHQGEIFDRTIIAEFTTLDRTRDEAAGLCQARLYASDSRVPLRDVQVFAALGQSIATGRPVACGIRFRDGAAYTGLLVDDTADRP